MTHRIKKNVKEERKRNTGWRRLIGSPKLQIIFHKRATKYRSLLRKMTYKDKRSYESSPPCTSLESNVSWVFLFVCRKISIFRFVTFLHRFSVFPFCHTRKDQKKNVLSHFSMQKCTRCVTREQMKTKRNGAALVSRIDKIIGL